jgi:short chain dehydrogenase
MSIRELSGSTAVVTGASRGFGRATAIALVDRGARVIGVARSEAALYELHAELGDNFDPVIADVTDPSLPRRIIAQYRPRTLVSTPAPPHPSGHCSNRPGTASAPIGTSMSGTCSTSSARPCRPPSNRDLWWSPIQRRRAARITT